MRALSSYTIPMNLSEKKCVACEGGIPPLAKEAVETYKKEINPAWSVIDNVKIKRSFTFKDFVHAMKFINQVAECAEAEGHHPDIFVSYNKVDISLWTHATQGLSENDFIMASKIDIIST